MTIHKAKGLEFNIVFLPYLFSRHIDKEEAWLQCENADKSLGLEEVQLPKTILATTAKGDLDPVFGVQLSEIKQKQLLDRLNLMYVAFTRPRERLYIFSEPFESNSSDVLKNAVSNAIKTLMHTLNTSDVFCYPSPGLGVLPETLVLAGDVQTPQEEPIRWESQPWEDRFKIRRQAPEHWLPGKVNEARQKGIAIHRIMEKIIDQPALKASGSKKEKGGPEEATLEEILNKIKNDPLYQEVFITDAEYLPERELLVPGRGALRPDLMIVYGNNVNVVDYKTGVPHASHEQQIRDYIDALKLAGYNHVRGYLVYLFEDECIRLV